VLHWQQPLLLSPPSMQRLVNAVLTVYPNPNYYWNRNHVVVRVDRRWHRQPLPIYCPLSVWHHLVDRLLWLRRRRQVMTYQRPVKRYALYSRMYSTTQ
jgi:hypothetical protein